MLDHVPITVSDIARAGRAFYDAIMRGPDGNRIEAVCHHAV
jgi:hypothetical protein